jgi:hypothetical protein
MNKALEVTSNPAVASRIFPELRSSIRLAFECSCRSQDVSGSGGSAAAFSLLRGWRKPYPETTGYMIPTFLRCAHMYEDLNLYERGVRMGEWLLDIRSPEGWFSRLTWAPENLGVPSIFNTAQILFGLVELAGVTGDHRYRDAADAAVSWMIDQQEPNGSWVKFAYVSNYFPDYYAQVCWSILAYYRMTGDHRARDCVVKCLYAILPHQTEKKSFQYMGYPPDVAAYTHTIANTLQGILECAIRLGQWEPYGVAAAEGFEKMLRMYETRKKMAGSYDKNWNGDYRYICLTGQCQIASAWLRIFEINENPRYLDTSIKAIREVTTYQKRSRLVKNTRGGIAGSHPIYKRYHRFDYRNWAGQFYIDASIDLICNLENQSPGSKAGS